MNIDSVRNGVVIDHITAGNGARLYELLGLDSLTCTVAFIRNVPSKKMGRKDIIKVDGTLSLNLDVIGYVDPAATVNIIRDGELVEKRNIERVHFAYQITIGNRDSLDGNTFCRNCDRLSIYITTNNGVSSVSGVVDNGILVETRDRDD